MDKQIELEHLTTAYYLEDRILKLNKELDRLNHNVPEAPKEPMKRLIEPVKPIKPSEPVKINPQKVKLLNYPNIKSPQIKSPSTWKKAIPYCIGGYIVSAIGNFIIDSVLISFVGLIVIFYSIFHALKLMKKDWVWVKQQQNEAIESIRKSDEYQQNCKKIDEENQKRLLAEEERVNQEYQKRYERYEKNCEDYEIKMVEYQKKCEQYQKDCEQYQKDYEQYQRDCQYYRENDLVEYEQEKTELRNVISKTQDALEDVYNKNIIPAQYRGIGAVAYLATFIGTSNYDLKFAIERYDQDISHRYQQEQIGVAKQQLNVAKQQLDVARQQLNMMRTQALILDEVLQNQYYANFLEEQTQDIQLHGNKLLRSIDNWQKADILLDEYRRYARKRALKKAKHK